MARMQCPRCEVIVKLDDQAVATHHVVRCANCQGLIPVDQCLLEQKKVSSRSPGKRRQPRQRIKRTTKVMRLAGFVVMAILVVVSLALILKAIQPRDEIAVNETRSVEAASEKVVHSPELLPPAPGNVASKKEVIKLTYTQLLRREQSLLNEMVTLLEGIQTLDEAKEGVAKMNRIRSDLKETRHQLEEAAKTVSKEEWAENLPFFANKAEREQQHDQRYFAARERLRGKPGFAPYVDQYTENSIGVNRFDLQRGSGKKDPPE